MKNCMRIKSKKIIYNQTLKQNLHFNFINNIEKIELIDELYNSLLFPYFL